MNYWNFKMYDKPYSINVIWDGPCWIKKPELNTILVLQYVIFPAIPKKIDRKKALDIGEILAVFSLNVPAQRLFISDGWTDEQR